MVKKRDYFSCIVLGAGISGLSCALTLAKKGIDVLVLCRSEDPMECNTSKAQGGIVYKGKDDSPLLLKKDIMAAGDNLCYEPAVDFISKEGPNVVEKVLIRDLSIPFATKNKKLELISEAAHSIARIIHIEDATGFYIQKRLLEEVKKYENVKILTNFTAIDLLTTRHHSTDYSLKYHLNNECIGVYALDNKTNDVYTLLSDFTVLAMGGFAKIFLHSTNVDGSIGAGISMAYRAGAYILNTEYVQFHPTALYHPMAGRFLISEALRGAGARLRNTKGEYFMEKYSPEQKDLAPRDIVARAILEEMVETHSEFVFLDLANFYKDEIPIEKKFPSIFKECLKYGIDIRKEPIPVVPAAHYCCGGVLSNLEGETTINNLYAIGEVACTGVHGANRLASTSLLEGLLWGVSSAENIIEKINKGKRVKKEIKETILDWIPSGTKDEEDPALILQDWNLIKSTMWNYVGIVRTKERLERAQAEMVDLGKRLGKFYHESKLTQKILELFQGNLVAQIVSSSALRATKSRGSHFRKS
jgi:L-aspartate oxidase